MQNQQDVLNTDQRISESALFIDLFKPLWRARRGIAAVAFIALIAGVLISLNKHPIYKSDVFFQFGGPIPIGRDGPAGIGLADYKRYMAASASGERFLAFVQEKKLGDTAGIDELRAEFAAPGAVMQLIEPIKLDQKELSEQPNTIISYNKITGLHIHSHSVSPKNAQQIVTLLGRYVMDTIIYSVYLDDLNYRQAEIKTDLIRLENMIINSRTQLENYRQRIEDLKQIIARHPNAEKQSERQVITVNEDNARYLSPITQLMTAEVQITEINQTILKIKREQLQKMLLLKYYERARLILDSTKSGETVLRSLESVKNEVFKEQNLQDDMVKEPYNTITIDNQSALNLYLNKSHFITEPSLSEDKPAHRFLLPVISMLLGLLVAAIFVLAREWWRENRGLLSA